jgi:hypothetical protein
MKRAVYCGLISAVFGFLIAAYLLSPRPSSLPHWMSSRIAYVLCPPGILARMSMTDPDAESIWILFAPLNALIYGGLGCTLWLVLAGDDDGSASSKAGSDRPLGL